MRCCRSLISAITVSRVSSIDYSFFCRRIVLPFRVVVRRAPLAMRSLFVSFALLGMGLAAPAIVAQKVELSVDVSKAGAKIDRNIFGQFAEHLGHGIYEGIWVGSGFHDSQYSRHPQRRCCRAEGASRYQTFAGQAAASPTNTTGATELAVRER